MALTDPELDLLREILEHDPASDVFLQVGGELVRRGDWAEAEEVLSTGLAHAPSVEGSRLLARAALENEHFDLALSMLEKIDTDPGSAPEAAVVEILALERGGFLQEAGQAAEAFLGHHPNDVVVETVLERLSAPPPDPRARASDPFVNVARAERYVAVGRVDRAVRAYRRILHHNPTQMGLELRLRQLASGETSRPDDLSEELTDPGLSPPDLTMPTPGLSEPRPQLGASAALAATPIPAALASFAKGSSVATPIEDPDEEDTDLIALTPTAPVPKSPGKRRRRRRSLIRR